MSKRTREELLHVWSLIESDITNPECNPKHISSIHRMRDASLAAYDEGEHDLAGWISAFAAALTRKESRRLLRRNLLSIGLTMVLMNGGKDA
jgi:hypothetical protein